MTNILFSGPDIAQGAELVVNSSEPQLLQSLTPKTLGRLFAIRLIHHGVESEVADKSKTWKQERTLR